MGVVYRAQDPKIGRTLAIKSIRLNELTDPEERSRMRERLFREAQSAGILSHPHIVTIYDVSEEEGMAYIFMEFVNGMALDELLRATPPPTGALVMELLSQTAAALDYAHKNGIVHRDIKPSNIMVHEGRAAKVCDFGVAKIVSQQMTQAGLLMGTPSYMSPEQIEGRPMDGRSDQFALAVMVFDILTGEKPFTGDSLPILLYKICRADPPSASAINTTLGIWVDPVLRKALTKNPDDRYPSCAAFIEELRRALDERQGWMLPGKGFPGEDSSTGSGHHSGLTTVMPLTSPPPRPPSMPSGGIMRPPTDPGSPPFARSTANPPIPAPPLPLREPSMREPSQPSLTRPAVAFGAPEPIPLPRPREERPKGTNPLFYAVPIVALLLGGGFFAFQKFSTPKTVVVEQPPDQPAVDPPKPDAAPKVPVAKPSAVTQGTTPALPPEVKPAAPTDPRPNATGQFSVQFMGSPPGVNVTVDGDSSTACKTPCAIPLTKGRHTMTGVQDGYRSLARAFEVTASATTVQVDLIESMGILSITSTPPGATITLNGQERPEKTPAELRIKPGSYTVVVSRDGQRDSSTVTVKDGVPGTLNITF